MNNLFRNIILLVIIICIILFGVYIINKLKTVEHFTYEPVIYFINLEKSTDRWIKITKQLDQLKITNYKKFNGIEGSSYKLNNIEKNIFRKANFNYKRKKGVTGCALSHIYVWKEMVEKKIEECIICEDDTVLNKNFMEELEEINKIKNNYDIIFLYNTIGHIRDNNQNNEIIPYNKVHWYGCGAVSYYINNHAANILLNIVFTKGIYDAIDYFMYRQYKNLKIGIAKYPLLKLDDTYSVIAVNNNR